MFLRYLNIATSHIILSSWITTNLSCFSSPSPATIHCVHLVLPFNASRYTLDVKCLYFSQRTDPLSFSYSSFFFLPCWIYTWSNCLVVHFSLACLLACLSVACSCFHVCDYIDLMVSNHQITLVFRFNPVNQWRFFSILMHFYFRLCATVCEGFMSFSYACFVLFNLIKDGPIRCDEQIMMTIF